MINRKKLLIRVSITCSIVYIFKTKVLTIRLLIFSPINNQQTLLIKFHCINKCLSFVICQLWNTTMKIWCTCLLEYFDLIKQVIAFKIRDNSLIKDDGYSCNPLCIFLCLLLSLFRFSNKWCCLSS